MDYFLILAIFLFGYSAIVFEQTLRVNKTASALLMAALSWTTFFLLAAPPLSEKIDLLLKHLGETSELLFFLLGAMVLVELIDTHKGFKTITDVIHTRSRKTLLWILGFIAFFLSAVLDNLTTMVVMLSLLGKLIDDPKERLLFGSGFVIAVNAGGVWTPIGDITTTMLWIGKTISTLEIMKTLFLPSLAAFAIAFHVIGRNFRGESREIATRLREETAEPKARLVFWCSLGGLILVPLLKAATGLPPFMGMLTMVGALWVLTDRLHHRHRHRQHLLVSHALTRIDTSGILFFLGILLCMGALDAVGALTDLATFLDRTVGNIRAIATIIGLLSSVIDNIPLVAAGMKMYDFPMNAPFWSLLAYSAGTGGSLFIIGSAAGIVFMGIEKVSFGWYARKIAPVALLSYAAGLGVYLIQELL